MSMTQEEEELVVNSIKPYPLTGVWTTPSDVPVGIVVNDGGVIKQSRYRHKIDKLIPYLKLIGTRRLDIGGVGDSNQLLGGYGWDSGISKGLIDENISPYATPLFGFTQNNNSGSGAGYLTSLAQGVSIPIVDFPPNYSDYQFTLGNATEWISTTQQGVYSETGDYYPKRVLSNGGYFSESSGTIRHHGRIGQTASSATYSEFARLDESPYTTYKNVTNVAVQSGGDLYDISFDTSVPDLTKNISCCFGFQTTSKITGEFFGLFQRTEVLENTTGLTQTTICYKGGESLRDVASAFQYTALEGVKEILRGLVFIQNATPKLLIRVCEGMNDRNDSDLSVGLNPTASNTTDGFKDNAKALIDRVGEAWVSLGYSINDLFWLLTPSHQPDESDTIAPFRVACSELVDELPNVGYYDFTKDFTYAEMVSNLYYFIGETNGSAHLSTAGYDALGLKEIQEVMGMTKELVPL